MLNLKKVKRRSYSIEELDKAMGWTEDELRRIDEDVKFKRIAYKIREIRDDEGLTQEELAKKAKVPRSMIANIESGKRNTTIKTLMNIAESIGSEVEITFVKKKR
jgi:DNA-binding XRE family transcriptional regulator